jgi:lysophospholipase L1-like esterase
MKFKRLVVFGDSWTKGVGSNLYVEKKLFKRYDKDKAKKISEKYQIKHSWGNNLSNKLNIPIINNSEIGCSNNTILQFVLDFHKKEFRNCKDNLFIIMWSSGLRDDLSFIPESIKKISRVGYSFSYKDIFKAKKDLKRGHFNPYFGIHDDSDEYDIETIEPFFKEFVNNIIMDDLIDNSYFDFQNQMKIYFLQQYLDYFNINYVMCDAFESMFSYSDNKKSYINLENYFFPNNEKTFSDYLNKNYGESVFEHFGIEKAYYDNGSHPNKKGYKIISNLLYEFISKKFR